MINGINNTVDTEHILSLRDELTQQYKNNISLYRSLSFEPTRYRQRRPFQKALVQYEGGLASNISSLILRMTSANDIGAHKDSQYQPLSGFIEILKEQINRAQQLTTSIDSNTTDQISADLFDQTSSLYQQLATDSERMVVKFNEKELSYEAFIFYISINHIIRDASASISDYVT